MSYRTGLSWSEIVALSQGKKEEPVKKIRISKWNGYLAKYDHPSRGEMRSFADSAAMAEHRMRVRVGTEPEVELVDEIAPSNNVVATTRVNHEMIECAGCDRMIEKSHPGRFLCGSPECRTKAIQGVKVHEIANRALTFLAGLNLQDQSTKTQREQTEIVAQLLRTLKPERYNK